MTDTGIRALLAELEPDAILQQMRYSNSKGVEREHPLWFTFAHLFNHQTHHRGQVTALLFQLGHDPGMTDLLAVLNLPR